MKLRYNDNFIIDRYNDRYCLTLYLLIMFVKHLQTAWNQTRRRVGTIQADNNLFSSERVKDSVHSFIMGVFFSILSILDIFLNMIGLDLFVYILRYWSSVCAYCIVYIYSLKENKKKRNQDGSHRSVMMAICQIRMLETDMSLLPGRSMSSTRDRRGYTTTVVPGRLHHQRKRRPQLRPLPHLYHRMSLDPLNHLVPNPQSGQLPQRGPQLQLLPQVPQK